MGEIVLLDGETYSYDIVMPLKEFFWANQELFLSAYIDGREIEHRQQDTDNIERRWFCIRRVNTEDTLFDVIYVGYYSAYTPVYVELYGADFWDDYAKQTNALITKYESAQGGK